jgi:hypothetical protein
MKRQKASASVHTMRKRIQALTAEIKAVQHFARLPVRFVVNAKADMLRKRRDFIPVHQYRYGIPVTGEIGRVGQVRYRLHS